MNSNSSSYYDVIIIGAGSIGTPTAFYLAQAGSKVLVLDTEASVGQGSNKRAIGGVRATHSDPAKIRLCLRSLDIFSNWQTTYGDDIEWFKGGYCFVAYREQEKKNLMELLARQKSFGLNIDWLDNQELLEVVPDLNPANLLGGTFSPDDGSASPLLVVHAYYRHAKELGAEFHFNETVTGIEIAANRIRAVKTNKGIYHADIVINSAGPWGAEVAHLAGLEIPVQPDSHESAITEPVAHFLNPMIVDIRNMPGSSNFYFYQHYTGQILFCITPSPSIWGFDIKETSSFLPMAAHRMIELLPRLKNIRVRRTWRGLYPMTPDGFPIIGRVKEMEGFILAAGMCGQGFMLGPGVAELISRLVHNQLSIEDEEILRYMSPYRQFKGEELLK